MNKIKSLNNLWKEINFENSITLQLLNNKYIQLNIGKYNDISSIDNISNIIINGYDIDIFIYTLKNFKGVCDKYSGKYKNIDCEFKYINSIEIKLNKNNFILDKKHILENYCGIDWKKYIKINIDNYNRHTIFKNDLYELVIITWYHNQSTKIHSHPINGCLFKVLKNKINEKIILNSKSLELIHNKNDVSFIHNKYGLHKMTNCYKKICVSLHIYSPPFNL